MATRVLRDCGLFLGSYDLTGQMNKVRFEAMAEQLDNTAFSTGVAVATRTFEPGLTNFEASADGWFEASSSATASVDKRLFSEIGGNDSLLTILPGGFDEDSPALAVLAETAKYQPGGQVGELAKWTAEFKASSAPYGGKVFMTPLQKTATGAKAAKVQLGAVPAGSYVVGQLHVFQFNGTSLDVIVRSDANASSGGETTRLTFAQATGITNERVSAAGAITDTWWDATWTFVGTSFTGVLSVGIWTP